MRRGMTRHTFSRGAVGGLSFLGLGSRRHNRLKMFENLYEDEENRLNESNTCCY
jgi:hypothetical protein